MMNCAICLSDDASVRGGPFMYKGTSYCKRHLLTVRVDELEVPNDASEPKLKWTDQKEKK